MKMLVVNKTSTAGHQKQEQEEKLPQVSAIPCIWGMFLGKTLYLHVGQRENMSTEAVMRYQKVTCMILDLEQQ